jgi:crotonobetainyl-CoA:carnitine CoA-transferase CaiB-like acyl-CoA transferase
VSDPPTDEGLGPLAGLTVIDLATLFAGPLAATHLGWCRAAAGRSEGRAAMAAEARGTPARRLPSADVSR